MDPIVILGIAVVVILSITTHEAAHGFVADHFGDSTARDRGRLTLNPIPHIDPIFTIAMPAVLLLMGSPILFGGAKPVPVNVRNLRNPRRDWAIVGAAGPLTNLAIAAALSLIMAVAVHGFDVSVDGRLVEVLAVGIYVNVLLCVFNLLPIPPLDGSRVVQLFLSRSMLLAYQRIEQYGLLIIIALIVFVPAMQILLASLVQGVTLLLTVPFGIERAVLAGLNNLMR
jgi:Zn-dependent protease